MSRRVYECEVCGGEHRYPISAALCCSTIQDDPRDTLDNPNIIPTVD